MDDDCDNERPASMFNGANAMKRDNLPDVSEIDETKRYTESEL